MVHLLIAGLSILADVTWRRRFCREDEGNQVVSDEGITNRSPDQKVRSPQRWTHLVYSYLEGRFLQGSWCSQVWNECSHRELAALVGRLSVLARGQEAALRDWEGPAGSLSHVPAIYTSTLAALHSFRSTNVSGDAHLKDGSQRIGCEATVSGRSDTILPETPGWKC